MESFVLFDRYVCMVTSSVGEERTHTTLEIWAPLNAHISPQIQTVDVGGSASFNCTAEGFPLENITWVKVRAFPLCILKRIIFKTVHSGRRTFEIQFENSFGIAQTSRCK